MFIFLRKQHNPPKKQEDAKTLTSSVLYGLGEPFLWFSWAHALSPNKSHPIVCSIPLLWLLWFTSSSSL